MARPPSSQPTELETEILKILWRDGPSTVRQVRKALVGFRDLAHTSVITIMNIMIEKGYLQRTRHGLHYVYKTRVSREATSRKVLQDVVQRIFDGSASAAVFNLLETGDLDSDTLKQMRELIDRKFKEQQP